MKVDERPDDPVVYVMVDCEASGMIPGLFNLVSLGAVAVVYEGGRHRVLEDELYLEFKPVFPGFNREAMRIHGITRRHLEQHGVEPKAGMQRFRKWALGLRQSDRHQLVFAGHNAPFDWSYISYYFGWAKMRNPFGYKALDTKALAMGKLGIPWLATNKGLLTEMLPGVEPEDKTQKHRADYDARYQAQILAALLDYQPPKAGRKR